MDDVEDLFPQRPLPASDPTLSTDGLDGFFDDAPDPTLAVDSVAELFESAVDPVAANPPAEPAAESPAPSELEPDSVDVPAATLEVNDDLEDMFDAAATVDHDAVEPAGAPPADAAAPIGELVASLAEELQKLEAALHETDDDDAS